MRGQIGNYAYMKKLFYHSINVGKVPQEAHKHKTTKSKSTSNKLKDEFFFVLKIHYSSEQKKINKVDIIKYFLTSNRKTKKSGRG